MEKQEKNLIINKENYKGYVELYKAFHYMTEDENYFFKEMFKKLIKIFFIGLCIVAVTAPFVLVPVVEVMLNIELMTWVASIIGLAGIYGKKTSDMKKEKLAAIKEKYPYVDIDVKDLSLEKSLADVGIIQKEHENGFCFVNLKVEEYENYLKAEEVKENYLEETKYDGYVVNPEIEEQELEKVRVKVKLLTR